MEERRAGEMRYAEQASGGVGESTSLVVSAGGGGLGSRWGDGLRRLEEAERGGAKDCSNGFGSRSKSERFCRTGRRAWGAGEREGDWLFGDMTHDRRLNHSVTMRAQHNDDC